MGSYLVEVCGARCYTWPKGWKLHRKPRCNRNAGHDGEHTERNLHTFAVLARWEPGT